MSTDSIEYKWFVVAPYFRNVFRCKQSKVVSICSFTEQITVWHQLCAFGFHNYIAFDFLFLLFFFLFSNFNQQIFHITHTHMRFNHTNIAIVKPFCCCFWNCNSIEQQNILFSMISIFSLRVHFSLVLIWFHLVLFFLSFSLSVRLFFMYSSCSIEMKTNNNSPYPLNDRCWF